MGQSCCSHIFENTFDEMLEDVITNTCLFNYSYFQFHVMFSELVKEFEVNNLDEDENDIDLKYKSMITQYFLGEEYTNIKEVSASSFFDYRSTFRLTTSVRRTCDLERNMIGNCKPMAVFLLGMLGFANDLDKSQLIFDLCLILQFKLEVGSFEKFLRIYLVRSICNTYDFAYQFCCQNLNSYILGYYIDNDFLNAALISKNSVNECVEEIADNIYNGCFIKICTSHFNATTSENVLDIEELKEQKLPKQVLEEFINSNPWLFCLRKLHNHIKDFIRNKEKQIKQGNLQSEEQTIL